MSCWLSAACLQAEFYLVDPETGDSVVPSASIPHRAQLKLHLIAPPAAPVAAAAVGAANGSANGHTLPPPRPGAVVSPAVLPGEAGAEPVVAAGEAEGLEAKKKPCCVVM